MAKVGWPGTARGRGGQPALESQVAGPDRTAQEAEDNELLALIDTHLPVELRADFLRMRAGGVKGMPSDRKKRVRAAVAAIMAEAAHCDTPG
jgi:hypothetical protein